MQEFDKMLHNLYTTEHETIACECCGDEFERELGTEYTLCSKACLKEMQAEARGDI